MEDGSLYVGEHFGAEVEAEAEVVFNTSMTGYLEVCTDPSYRGQMVAMCHPQIGNYGVARSHRESTRPWVAALIVRELAMLPHHWEAEGTLPEYLAESGVPGIQGLDTRALVRRLRMAGTLRAVLRLAGRDGFSEADIARARVDARAVVDLSDKVVVGDVSGAGTAAVESPVGGRRIAVVDLGTKHNIVRSLARRGLTPVVFDWKTSADDVVASGAEGVVISNGPGDPATLPDAVEATATLISSGLPVLGICLGHQMIGRAIGATTSRLRCGHHGGNHPVMELATRQVTMTTQNHEFQVDDGPAVTDAGFVVSHRNLHDGSIEGLAHLDRPVFSVQYHPEGCPGPQDNQLLFDRFLSLVAKKGGSR
ncbi:MAG: glutamine-hydrolyzing carbamoyl-phosphate synthase small subunit [Chloroflexi bacterium]|nr:glutamine-hydrolyzing carbamoyl-phosphate synthase small subunit [Chloroflexota bacterium]